jgi:hypothetical protein
VRLSTKSALLEGREVRRAPGVSEGHISSTFKSEERSKQEISRKRWQVVSLNMEAMSPNYTALNPQTSQSLLLLSFDITALGSSCSCYEGSFSMGGG